jgi:hypothetical protein
VTTLLKHFGNLLLASDAGGTDVKTLLAQVGRNVCIHVGTLCGVIPLGKKHTPRL